ncbi:DNA recombination protein RmuC [Candidatus Saccharibacteria bacterium]|nr:MAG: DNA recombination protein RmuC [Candidatus Saccharibacteria bacterium]
MGISLILGVVVVALAVVIVILLQRKPDNQSSLLIKEDLRALSQDIDRLKDTMQSQVSERLDKGQASMLSALQKQSTDSNRVITEITRNLAELKESNKRVVGVADELRTIQNVLQNPKQRGVLGEYYLNQVLENVLPPERFKLQHKIGRGDDGRDLVCDAVIILDKGKMLPVDSKFSLENYNRLIESNNKAERETLVKQFKADLKQRIDETAKYIRPGDGTMDFAFMFIPSEAIYYDLLINKVGSASTSSRDLIEYAFRDKKVIIVSPTSFLAYLQTVLQGLRSLQIEEQAKEIQLRVGQLGEHLKKYDSFMQKLGNSLGTTVGHFNNAHKELKKVDKDVVRVTGTSPGIEPLMLDRPQDRED